MHCKPPWKDLIASLSGLRSYFWTIRRSLGSCVSFPHEGGLWLCLIFLNPSKNEHIAPVLFSLTNVGIGEPQESYKLTVILILEGYFSRPFPKTLQNKYKIGILVAQCSAIGVSVAATPPCRRDPFLQGNLPATRWQGGGKMGCDRVFFGGGGMWARHPRDISKNCVNVPATLCALYCVARQGSQQWQDTKTGIVSLIVPSKDSFTCRQAKPKIILKDA